MVWKCISQTLSTVSSFSNVTKPNPRCLLVCWSINMTASSTLPETRHQPQTNVSSQKSKQFLVREEKFGKKCVVADDILCDAITGRRISQFFLPLWYIRKLFWLENHLLSGEGCYYLQTGERFVIFHCSVLTPPTTIWPLEESSGGERGGGILLLLYFEYWM